jgi:predicted TPR repeat methyltransferase
VKADLNLVSQHKTGVEAFAFGDDCHDVIYNYDEYAGEYDFILNTCLGYRDPQYAVQTLLSCSNLNSNARFIDFGCGTGFVGEELAKAGFTDLVGLDASSEMLRLCQEKRVYREL